MKLYIPLYLTNHLANLVQLNHQASLPRGEHYKQGYPSLSLRCLSSRAQQS